jgi:hypothetical protein
MCAILAVHPAFNQGSQKYRGLCKGVGLHYITSGEPATRYFQEKTAVTGGKILRIFNDLLNLG